MGRSIFEIDSWISSSVVYQNVEPFRAASNQPEPTHNLGFLSQINRLKHGAGPQFRGQCPARAKVAVTEKNRGAFLMEFADQSRADSVGAAGDNDVGALERTDWFVVGHAVPES